MGGGWSTLYFGPTRSPIPSFVRAHGGGGGTSIWILLELGNSVIFKMEYVEYPIVSKQSYCQPWKATLRCLN